MLQFINPAWLWGIGAVILPVVVHLWNVNRGKVLKVGSISLLSESTRKTARNLRLNEWLLLLLRSMLIVLISLLLAKPRWVPRMAGSVGKGWILAEPGQKAFITENFKEITDSLQTEGFVWKEFSPGFPDWKENSGSGTASQPPADYWELIRMSADRLPDGFPVFLFTGNELRHFKGSRPSISFDLHWFVNKVTDSSSTLPVEAHAINDDSVYISVMRSGPGESLITPVIVPLANSPENNFLFKKGNGGLQLTDKSGISIDVDTAALLITVYYDPAFRTDVYYLNAALQTIQEVRKRKIRIRLTQKVQDVPDVQDWLFWLADIDIPANIHAKKILRYAEGKPAESNTVLRLPEEGMENASLIRIYKKIEGQHDSLAGGRTIWFDGTGYPLMYMFQEDAENFIFYSRFDPAWSNLVWHSRFPELIYHLLYPPESNQLVKDYHKGRISVSQMMPLRHSGITKNQPPKTPASSLTRSFWVLLFLVFLMERMVSHRVVKYKSHGG